MTSHFKRGTKVLYQTRGGDLVLARIKTAHRDGTVTVHAMWFLDSNGDPRPGYLGDEFRREVGGLTFYRDLRDVA